MRELKLKQVIFHDYIYIYIYSSLDEAKYRRKKCKQDISIIKIERRNEYKIYAIIKVLVKNDTTTKNLESFIFLVFESMAAAKTAKNWFDYKTRETK